MATVDKVYHFAADAESIVDQGSSANIVFSYDGGNGSPATGCLKVADTAAHASQTEYAYRTATGETWVTWGVPSGSTVTSIQIVSWNRKQTASSIFATSQNVGMDLIGSGGASIIAGESVNFSPAIGAPDVSWHADTSGSSQSVNGGSQSTGTDVRLRIRCTINTTGDITPGFSFLMDEITIRITYTPAIPKLFTEILQAPPRKKLPLDTDFSMSMNTVALPPTTPNKLMFSMLFDNRGATWHNDTIIAQSVDPYSAAMVKVANKYIVTYSAGEVLKGIVSENPEVQSSWGASFALSTTQAGRVYGMSVNDSGIICLGIGREAAYGTPMAGVGISRDMGRSWEFSTSVPWSAPFRVFSVANIFVVTAVSGATITHYLSFDGGTTWV